MHNIAFIVKGLREKELNCFEPTECYNRCTVRDTSGVKLDLLLTTALKMTEMLEVPDGVEMFSGIVTFCAPSTDIEKAVWEAKHQ